MAGVVNSSRYRHGFVRTSSGPPSLPPFACRPPVLERLFPSCRPRASRDSLPSPSARVTRFLLLRRPTPSLQRPPRARAATSEASGRSEAFFFFLLSSVSPFSLTLPCSVLVQEPLRGQPALQVHGAGGARPAGAYWSPQGSASARGLLLCGGAFGCPAPLRRCWIC